MFTLSTKLMIHFADNQMDADVKEDEFCFKAAINALIEFAFRFLCDMLLEVSSMGDWYVIREMRRTVDSYDCAGCRVGRPTSFRSQSIGS